MNIDEELLDEELLEDDDFLTNIVDEEENDNFPDFDTYDDIDE